MSPIMICGGGVDVFEFVHALARAGVFAEKKLQRN